MGRKEASKKGTAEEPETEACTPALEAKANVSTRATDDMGLAKILDEIRDFRKDVKQQLNDIKSDLANVSQRITEVESCVEVMDDRVQVVESTLGKLLKVISQHENKLLDQEGRSRRENLRIYNVPEGAEGSSMTDFVERILRDTLEIPLTTSLDIERAHRALVPRPSDTSGDKPRSIVIKFLRYKTKEDVIPSIEAEEDPLPDTVPGEAACILRGWDPAVSVCGGGDEGHEGERAARQRGQTKGELDGAAVPYSLGSYERSDSTRSGGRATAEHQGEIARLQETTTEPSGRTMTQLLANMLEMSINSRPGVLPQPHTYVCIKAVLLLPTQRCTLLGPSWQAWITTTTLTVDHAKTLMAHFKGWKGSQPPAHDDPRGLGLLSGDPGPTLQELKEQKVRRGRVGE
ncbi:uncharacterized protein LOC144025446 [Festucalex cinctus]